MVSLFLMLGLTGLNGVSLLTRLARGSTYPSIPETRAFGAEDPTPHHRPSRFLQAFGYRIVIFLLTCCGVVQQEVYKLTARQCILCSHVVQALHELDSKLGEGG